MPARRRTRPDKKGGRPVESKAAKAMDHAGEAGKRPDADAPKAAENRSPFADKSLLLILFIAALIVLNDKYFMAFEGGFDYVSLATQPVENILAQKYWSDQPPLYFLSLKAWIYFFGKSEESIRALLFMFYAGLIVLTYEVALKVFASRFTALLSSMLICLNPVVVWFTFDAKYWTVFATLTMLSIRLFMRYVEKPTFKNQAAWGLSAAILPALCLPGCAVAAAFVTEIYLTVLLKRLKVRDIIVPLVLMAVFALPVAINFERITYDLMTFQGSGDGFKGVEPDKMADYAVGVVYHLLFVYRHQDLWRGAFLYFMLASAAAGVLLNVRSKYTRLLLLMAVITLFSGYVASNYTNVRQRYSIALVPIWFMLSANAISKIPSWRAAAVLTLCILIFYSASFYQFFENYLNFPEWRGAAGVVRQIDDPGVVVISDIRRFQKSFADMYLGMPYVPARNLDTLTLPPSDKVVLIHDDGEWVEKLGRFKDEFYFNRTWILNGVYVHQMTRKDNGAGLLSKGFDKAIIRLLIGDTRIDCRSPNQSQTCFSRDWQRIEVKDGIMIGGSMRRCIFAHPRNNQTVELVFPEVPQKKSLKVWAGLEDDAVFEEKQLSQCYMDVYVNGSKVDTLIIPSKRGYAQYDIDTSKYEGVDVRVTFRISADWDESRHLCFNAEASDDAYSAPDDYFYRNVEKARVSLTDENGTLNCSIWRNAPIYPHNEQRPPFVEGKLFGRWDCKPKLLEKNKLWENYGKGFDRSDGDYREAIWAHPHQGGTLRAEYDDVPIGSSIRGFYGVNDLASARMEVNSTITFKVYVDGKEVYTGRTGKEKGWNAFSTGNLTSKERASVAFETTIEPKDSWAHFFFNAYLT
jgi:4-amino-4-deoxy-L-arabinose transferase-like glycosyltransferase